MINQDYKEILINKGISIIFLFLGSELLKLK